MHCNAEAVSILRKVIDTMDTIPVCGIDNQDKFVGCAGALNRVIHLLQQPEKSEVVTDG